MSKYQKFMLGVTDRQKELNKFVEYQNKIKPSESESDTDTDTPEKYTDKLRPRPPKPQLNQPNPLCLLDLYQKLPIDMTNILIAVECQQAGGFGDLLISAKITKIIKHKFPKTKVIVVTKWLETINRHQLLPIDIPIFDYTDYCQYTNQHYLFQNKKVILITCALETNISIQSQYQHLYTNIFIDEYHGWRHQLKSHNQKRCLVPGLGQNACGINIDTSKLIGRNIKSTPYYFGYVSSANTPTNDCLYSLFLYIWSLVNIDNHNIRDNHYVRNNPNFLHFKIVCKGLYITDFNQALIKYWPYTGVILKSPPDFQITYYIWGAQLIDYHNLIRIDVYDSLLHTEMIGLIQDSQSPVLVTGDQSLSEAISANKLFFYQCHSWKCHLMSTIINYCHLNHQLVGDFIKISTILTTTKLDIISMVTMAPKIDVLTTLLKNPKLMVNYNII